MNKAALINLITLKDIPKDYGSFTRKQELYKLKRTLLQSIYNKIQDNIKNIENYYGKELSSLRIKDLEFFDTYTKEYILQYIVTVKRNEALHAIIYCLSTVKKCLESYENSKYFKFISELRLCQGKHINVSLDVFKESSEYSLYGIFGNVLYYQDSNKNICIDSQIILGFRKYDIVECLMYNVYRLKDLNIKIKHFKY